MYQIKDEPYHHNKQNKIEESRGGGPDHADHSTGNNSQGYPPGGRNIGAYRGENDQDTDGNHRSKIKGTLPEQGKAAEQFQIRVAYPSQYNPWTAVSRLREPGYNDPGKTDQGIQGNEKTQTR